MKQVTRILNLIYTDICGLIQTTIHSEKRYFIIFIDDYTYKACIYFLVRKDEAFEKFREFKVAMENETGCRIWTLCSDNGKEYVNKAF